MKARLVKESLEYIGQWNHDMPVNKIVGELNGGRVNEKKILGPFVVAFVGRMPGASEDELVDTEDGFKSLGDAIQWAKKNPKGRLYGEPMSIKDWKRQFWSN